MDPEEKELPIVDEDGEPEIGDEEDDEPLDFPGPRTGTDPNP
jgi:hypothetical protein